MLNIDEVELHDALLKSMQIDYSEKRVSILLDAYMEPNASERSSMEIVFEGVDAISQVCDLERLQKNAFAGSINYWIPSKDNKPTYIYLCDGLLGITAAKVTASKCA